MARKILDDAWPKYSQALPTIERGIANLQPPPLETLDAVTELLQVDVPIRVHLLLFVGGFDNNAFTSPGKNGIYYLRNNSAVFDLVSTFSTTYSEAKERSGEGAKIGKVCSLIIHRLLKLSAPDPVQLDRLSPLSRNKATNASRFTRSLARRETPRSLRIERVLVPPC